MNNKRKRYKPNSRYEISKSHYVKNAIGSFFNTLIVVSIAVIVVGAYIIITDNSNQVSVIIFNNPISVLIGILLFTIWVTICNFIYSQIFVKKPVVDFINATNKVVNGDYSVRIDTSGLSYVNLEYLIIADNFNEMAEKLNLVDSISNDFVSNVSHELKTPLSVIQSYATILQNPEISKSEKEEYIKKILTSTKQLTTLVTNILKLNKIENDQIKPKVERFNISSQLSQCLLDFEDIWEKKELNIDYQVEDDIYISSDSELLFIVWKNLFSNAIKFSEIGGTLGVYLEKNSDHIAIKVKDTGCGMSKETQEHIFEKFYQGDTSHSAKGNGLGLALVKRVIDITGNKISVTSELGKGTCFTVELY